MAPGAVTLIVDKHRVPVTLTLIPPSSVKVTPAGTDALATQLATALQTKVDVGPLPYGLRLTGITRRRERRARQRARAARAARSSSSAQVSSTARSPRCTPILRLTRCSALSTAFGSHSQLVAISS